MTGWTGKILKVDLSAKQSEVLQLSDAVYHQYIGGRGLAGYFLRQAAGFAWDNPQMPLLLFTGPLTGTTAPASGHVIFASRSPLTGIHFDESVGGGLGKQLKAAGYDGLVITGRSDELTGIEISDEAVCFANADALAPLTTSQSTEALRRFGAFAATGPAAHHGVRFASVTVDRYHGAYRGGLGLAFAQKNLKYIGVTGTGRVSVANDAQLRTACDDIARLTSASSILRGENGFANLGTAALFDLIHTRHMMPTANFRRTYFEPAPVLNAASIRDAVDPVSFACAACPVGCRRKTLDGTAVPDYETLAHFSALLENDSLQTVLDATALCAELGMDPVSAAVTLACYSDLRKERLSPKRIVTLLAEMGAGNGEGAALAEGSVRFAAAAGNPALAMAVKGLELPAYDPRGAYGLALGYATSTRGGCHLRAYPLRHEVLRKPVATDRFSFSGKARIIKIAEDQLSVADSLAVCPFMMMAASLEEYGKALGAVTGVAMDGTDLARAGARIYYGERMLNSHWGCAAADDDLPARFFSEDGTGGPGFDVPRISRDDFLAARQRYYAVRGLDDAGLPQRSVAEELGVAWIS